MEKNWFFVKRDGTSKVLRMLRTQTGRRKRKIEAWLDIHNTVNHIASQRIMRNMGKTRANFHAPSFKGWLISVTMVSWLPSSTVVLSLESFDVYIFCTYWKKDRLVTTNADRLCRWFWSDTSRIWFRIVWNDDEFWDLYGDSVRRFALKAVWKLDNDRLVRFDPERLSETWEA